jgi:hypothetical protein
MRRVLIGFLLPLVLLAAFLSGVTSASGAASKAAYDFHVADELLQEVAGSAEWAIAEADNGDRILVRGAGEFDAAAKTASGAGRFEHRLPDGSLFAAGNWTADRLVSFQFYGCGGEGLPPNFCGGLAKLAVTLTPDADPNLRFAGTLWVDCLIGDFPPSRTEGVRLNVKDLLNFNKTIGPPEGGLTVFIQH